MDKPDVDLIQGISPAMAIEQKTNTRNPRSTVGTSTEIYDYLRLLYARIGKTFCRQVRQSGGTGFGADGADCAAERRPEGARREVRISVTFPLPLHPKENRWTRRLPIFKKEGFFRVLVRETDR